MSLKLAKKDPILDRLRKKREILVLKEGKFYPKEGPTDAVMAPQLRHLPGEIVTKDDRDGTKAHELDPDHILHAVEQEFKEKEAEDRKGASPNERLAALLKPTTEYQPLTQYNIDFVKWRVQLGLLEQAVKLSHSGQPINTDAVFWLEFPERDLRIYNMKVGRQPKVFGKPFKHLRDFNVTFFLFGQPPPAVLDAMKVYGVQPPKIEEYVERLKYITGMRREINRKTNEYVRENIARANSIVR
jgi:hypothetical protein